MAARSIRDVKSALCALNPLTLAVSALRSRSGARRRAVLDAFRAALRGCGTSGLEVERGTALFVGAGLPRDTGKGLQRLHKVIASALGTYRRDKLAGNVTVHCQNDTSLVEVEQATISYHGGLFAVPVEKQLNAPSEGSKD